MLTREQATQLRSFMRESRGEARNNLRKAPGTPLDFEVLDRFDLFVTSLTEK